MDVAIVTDQSSVELDADNALLLAELRARGVDVEAVPWDVREFDWASTRLCVIRSTWDYVRRRSEFLRWVDRTARVTRVLNDSRALRWSSHKHYLKDLEVRGVGIVPTVVFPEGQPPRLRECVAERGWSEVVIKPAVSVFGRATKRFTIPTETDEASRHLEGLVAHEDALVQRYMAGVTEIGERSLIYIDGVFTHAVRRRPDQGDFRVGRTDSDSVASVVPRTAELLVADHVLASIRFRTLYARVDLLTDENDDVFLSELELVEPRLFLRRSPEAVARLGDVVKRFLEGRPTRVLSAGRRE